MDEPGAEAPRLRELGADPDAVLRLIRYFDGFDESDANADAVVRAAALLAECPAGARWPSGTTIRYDAAGRPLPAVMPPPEVIGEPAVWLERAGAAHALDAVLVDRLRHCLRVVAVRGSVAGPTGLDDPALLEVVLCRRHRGRLSGRLPAATAVARRRGRTDRRWRLVSLGSGRDPHTEFRRIAGRIHRTRALEGVKWPDSADGRRYGND